ncbi:unnamed protein product [Effrenium voratum]|nr:unnamed protein product [Effrenium voratum]
MPLARCQRDGLQRAAFRGKAPPRRPPRIQRILSDERWNLCLSVELFQAIHVRIFGASPVYRPQCGCCQAACGSGLASLAEWFRSLCEAWPEAEEPGHARLQRIHEERAREQAAAKVRAEEEKLEKERLSFGQLPVPVNADLAQSLVNALRQSAQQAEELASAYVPSKEEESGESLSDQLEKLLAKFEDQAPEVQDHASSQSTMNTEAPNASEAAALQDHIVACRAVEDRVVPLLPVLEQDEATTRLVTALAALEVGEDLRNHTSELLGGPFRSLSTADACWGLCSQKRRLILDQLPCGDWEQLRRRGVGWWLGDQNSLELLDVIVTKLAQSSLAKLRSNSSTWSGAWCEQEDAAQKRRKAIDEAVFWSTVLGSSVNKLRALMRAGLLKESDGKGLSALLQHEKVHEPEFLWKNAFRLLQLHRYHLAAGLFLLSGSVEEAARVLASHVKDLQLVIVVTRRHRDVLATLLGHHLQTNDPWRRLLLSHLGSAAEAVEAEADAEMFDSLLTCDSDAACLSAVAEQLNGMSLRH